MINIPGKPFGSLEASPKLEIPVSFINDSLSSALLGHRHAALRLLEGSIREKIHAKSHLNKIYYQHKDYTVRRGVCCIRLIQWLCKWSAMLANSDKIHQTGALLSLRSCSFTFQWILAGVIHIDFPSLRPMLWIVLSLRQLTLLKICFFKMAPLTQRWLNRLKSKQLFERIPVFCVGSVL